MTLLITGQQVHKGFLLAEPSHHLGNLVVLTGKNGCGKTRLLESIHKLLTSVEMDGKQLTNQEIMFVGQDQLTPNFGGGYNEGQFQTKITNTLQVFDQIKNDLDSPFNPQKPANLGHMVQESLPYESLYMLCQSIASYLHKPASKLTHEEIKIYFEDNIHSILGFQNISTVCNRYINRKKLNEYNRYRAEIKGKDIVFLTEDEFLKRFHKEPWVLLNDIIKSTFDDKFYFTEPDEESESYTYNAVLVQRDTGDAVTVTALSSGEKTLLWLALTLFNSQYYEKTVIKTPKLLLLDEPDAFLHPQMVVKMYRVLDAFSISYNSRIIITSHSPTTVALAPEKSTFIVSDNSIIPVTKDEAVAELLDGVTQISINPENRRQVFVESQYDANVYHSIFSKLLHNSDYLDPKVSLNFVSSGPKMPKQQLIDKVKQILKIDDEDLLDEFVKSINGVGNCVQVIGQVEALDQGDNETVRGIIDWDLKNKPSKGVSILAQDYAYSIENITLDPICILLLLHTSDPNKLTMDMICGSSIHWMDWLKDDELLQVSIDRFIYKVLNKTNNKEAKLSYISGKELLTDSEYLQMDGHALEKLVKKRFPELKGFSRTGKEGELKNSIVNNSMLNLTKGNFIPRFFESVLSSVQK